MIIPNRITRYGVPGEARPIYRYIGKNKANKIIKIIDSGSIQVCIGQLTLNDLDEFFREYEKALRHKKNAVIHDVKTRCLEGIKSRIYIKIQDSEGVFLGATIIRIRTLKDSSLELTTGFRAVPMNFRISGISIGNLLEGATFLYGEELGVDLYSKGKDRNGYGRLGANIGLAFHKLQQNFLPSFPTIYELIDLDALNIVENCVFFYGEQEKGSLKKVLLYIAHETDEIVNLSRLIEKRGLSVTKKYINLQK